MFYGRMRDEDPISENNVLSLMVKDCHRCGEQHEVCFQRFRGKSIMGFNHWGLCPNTMDPVLMSQKKIERMKREQL